MVKLLCPNCMKPVPVPDDFAGTEVTCPNCMKAFAAPARYNPAVLSEPPPPPPAVTPPPIPPRPPEPTMSPEVPPRPPEAAPAPAGYVTPAPPAAPAAPSPQVAGYTRTIGITLSPRVIAWLPAILLTVAFLCTGFRWIGSYLGGYPVYSQSPVRAIFGSVSRNFALEPNMPGGGAWIDNVKSDWGLMLPFMILLFLAAGIAWADRGFSGLNPRNIPPLAKVWAWRRTLIAGLAGLALLLVVIQVSRGFGMERAIRAMIRENPELVKAREAAAGSPAKLAAVENQEEAELAKFNLERTWWQDIALAGTALAVIALCVTILLERRGAKPPPKILLHY